MDTVEAQTEISTEAIAAEAANLCGAEHVATGNNLVAVAPANTEEIAAVLRWADRERIAVSPRGAGTKLGWTDPGAPRLLLRTARLGGVREHTWQDMTCTVGAGSTWESLGNALAPHGQFVALDALWPAQATVGGIVSANDSGALRLHYGGLRDLIIGMTIVLADGTVARSGGKVVKNVAGYDLHKLMCGAFGTLGVITEVNFRLHSVPRSSGSRTVRSSSAVPLGRLLLEVLHSHLSTEAMQLRQHREEFALDLQLAAMPEALATQIESFERTTAALGLSVELADNTIWSARQDLFARSGEDIVFKAALLPAQIAATVDRIAAAGGSSVAQAGGVLYGNAPLSAAEELAALRADLERGNGSLSVLHLPPHVALSRWGKVAGPVTLMREIKRRFDPHAILNAGCFLGDL